MSRNDSKHLLPSNALPSERSLSIAVRFGDDILPEDIKALWSVGDADEKFLSFLAWGLHVDFWNDDLSDKVKRELIAGSFQWHRKKGTKHAVEELCGIVFGDTQVRPWFEYGGQPYHFNISVDTTLPDQYAWEKFFLALDVTKSVRDWLDAIEIRRETTAEPYYGLGSVTSGMVDIGLGRPDYGRIPVYAGIGVTITGTIEILHGGGDVGWLT